MLLNTSSPSGTKATLTRYISEIQEKIMSAPDTNVEKQTRRHKPALIGMGVALLFGLLVFGLNVFETVEEAPAPAVGTE